MQMAAGCHKRAAMEGLPCDITWKDIPVPAVCEVFHYILDWSVGNGAAKYNTPSVDKLIPKLGYVKKNIRTISCEANNMKLSGNSAKHTALAEYIDTNVGLI
jgi:hypothetical protein